jgi:hypothetical protein
MNCTDFTGKPDGNLINRNKLCCTFKMVVFVQEVILLISIHFFMMELYIFYDGEIEEVVLIDITVDVCPAELFIFRGYVVLDMYTSQYQSV